MLGGGEDFFRTGHAHFQNHTQGFIQDFLLGGGGGGTLHNYSFFIGEGRIVLKTCKDLVSLGGVVWGILPQSFFLNLTTCLRLLLINNTEADGQAWGAGACFPRKF